MALTFGIIQIAVMWLLPPLLWIFLTRRLKVSWRYVALGAATWLSAMPFLFAAVMIAGFLSGGSPLVSVVALSVAAGIFEESSRYLYYRFSRALRRPSSWNEALVAGAGHGGTESIVLGLQSLMGLIVFFWYPQFLPAEMREIEPTARYFIEGAIARVMIIIIHIAFTMLVWRAVSRGRIGYLLAAIAIHIALDLILFGQPIVLEGYDWIGWAVLIAALVAAIWGILASRPSVTEIATPLNPEP